MKAYEWMQNMSVVMGMIHSNDKDNDNDNDGNEFKIMQLYHLERFKCFVSVLISEGKTIHLLALPCQQSSSRSTQRLL